MGRALSGSTNLDASASNATSVEFRLFGGVYGYNAPVICTATPTIYGWLCSWNTTTVPNGSYVLLSEAFNSTGERIQSGGRQHHGQEPGEPHRPDWFVFGHDLVRRRRWLCPIESRSSTPRIQEAPPWDR